VESIAKVRRDYFVDKKSIKQITRERQLSRNTVRKIIRSESTAFKYQRTSPQPQLGDYTEQLKAWLEGDAALPRKQRRHAKRLHQQLAEKGYAGAYDSIQRYVKQWKVDYQRGTPKAFIPLAFEPGDAMQFDWSEETVEIAGISQKIKAGHFRLCYSRKLFVVAFPREQLEMVLEAHRRAFNYFGGVSKRIIYDNPKTIVHKVLQGKERDLNKRFARMASHYLFEPVMCNPASGWEKGQVEKQVQDVRGWVFLPKLKFASMDDLNVHLQQESDGLNDSLQHPTIKDKTRSEMFEEEVPHLIAVARDYESYTQHECRASTTSLVRYDRNHYSVHAKAAGQRVSIRAFAEHIQVFYKDEMVAEHQRVFSRDQVRYNPWHYLNVLHKKPGALRDGAPFKQWDDLPAPLSKVRDRLAKLKGGDKAFISLLCAVETYSLEHVSQACEQALTEGVMQADWILNRLSHMNDVDEPETIEVSTALQLSIEPEACCEHYDSLLHYQEASHAIH